MRDEAPERGPDSTNGQDAGREGAGAGDTVQGPVDLASDLHRSLGDSLDSSPVESSAVATHVDSPGAQRRKRAPQSSGDSSLSMENRPSDPEGRSSRLEGTGPDGQDEESGNAAGRLSAGDFSARSSGSSAKGASGALPGRPSEIPVGASGEAPAISSRELLRLEEIARGRRFLLAIAGFLVLVCAALFAVGGDVLAKQITVAGAISGVAGALWFWWLIRDTSQYSPRRMAGIAAFSIAASYPVVYFCGVFSPAPALLVLGLAILGLGSGRSIIVASYVCCAVIQAGLAAMILAGYLPDRGLLMAPSLALTDAIALQVLIQLLMAGGFALTLASQRGRALASEQLDDAVRAIAQRDALLMEARHELDRALQIGSPGRHTDRMIGGIRLGNVIGRGAMGEIYEASSVEPTGSTDKKSRRRQRVAVKFLHPHALEKPNHVKRFMREAEVCMQLQSEHVIDVHDVGETEGVPYMVMERLRGRDLGFYLRSNRRLSGRRVVDLMRQLGAGLDVAWSAGVVHRDIKPQNVFLAENSDGSRVWKILDFGISKLADSKGTLTGGKVVGTPGYMAPEQALGKAVDYRCDMFSLGVIAYRALTGAPPFSGKDMAGVLYQVVYYMPRQPSSLVSLSDDLDRVLAIAMAKNPAERFKSGADLAHALTMAARSELDPGLRALGDAIVAAHPWGTKLGRGEQVDASRDRSGSPGNPPSD